MSLQGGGGASPIPGLTSDDANGIIVAGAMSAGAASESNHLLSGNLALTNFFPTDSPIMEIRQAGDGAFGGSGHPALFVHRDVSNDNPSRRALIAIENDDFNGTADALYYFSPDGNHDVRLNVHGGLGLFGHAAPAAPRTLPQATIDVIADANTKVAIQACANALADMGVLTLT